MTTSLRFHHTIRTFTVAVLLALVAWFATAVWFAASPPQGGRIVVDQSPPASVEVLSGHP